MPAISDRADAWQRAYRSLLQALAVATLVGLGHGADVVLAEGDMITAEHMLGAAVLGLVYAAAAWVHRNVDAHRHRRHGNSEDGG